MLCWGRTPVYDWFWDDGGIKTLLLCTILSWNYRILKSYIVLMIINDDDENKRQSSSIYHTPEE